MKASDNFELLMQLDTQVAAPATSPVAVEQLAPGADHPTAPGAKDDVAAFLDGPPKQERKPGDFFRDDKGVPWLAHPTWKVQPSGNKAELIDKCKASGIEVPEKVTVEQLKTLLGPRPKRVRYGRPSSLGKQIENTYNLEKWSERVHVLGVAILVSQGKIAAADYAGLDYEDQQDRLILDGLAREAKDAARAMLAADRGTHTHLTTQLDDEGKSWLAHAEEGEELGLPVGLQAQLVDAWQRMLVDYGLEILANEATVVNDTWWVAGTLDRIARLTRDLRFVTGSGQVVTLPAGTVVVLDIKTGKLTDVGGGYPRYWHSYAVQVCAYADAKPYDTDTDQRSEWPFTVDRDWALIAHLDVLAAIDGQATCTPLLVDLRAGREAGNLCVAAKQWQKRDDLFGVIESISDKDDGGLREEEERETYEPPDTTDLRSRIAALIDAGHTADMRLRWPAGVPTLSSGHQHTSAELDLLRRAVERVEAQHQMPFIQTVPEVVKADTYEPGDTVTYKGKQWRVGVDNGSSVYLPDLPDSLAFRDDHPKAGKFGGPPEYNRWVSKKDITLKSRLTPAPVLDDGEAISGIKVKALKARVEALPADRMAVVQRLAGEAQAAGLSVSVRQKPVERRYLIASALVAWAESDATEHDLWAVIGFASMPGQTTDLDQTLGALLGQFSIEQAREIGRVFSPADAHDTAATAA